MYTSTRQRRQQQRRHHALARVVEFIAGSLAMVLIAAMFTWVLINWVTGCGETWVTYAGDRIHGECVLMPWRD